MRKQRDVVLTLAIICQLYWTYASLTTFLFVHGQEFSRSRVFSLRFTRVRGCCTMPLSQAQVEVLKTPTTVIEIQGANPKKPGNKSFERFDRYETATTIGDATTKGANWQDLSTDFEKGYLKVPRLMDADAHRDPEAQKDQFLKAPQTEKLKQSAKCLPQNSCPEPWYKKIRTQFRRWK